MQQNIMLLSIMLCRDSAAASKEAQADAASFA
jgi:hypothetical protein